MNEGIVLLVIVGVALLGWWWLRRRNRARGPAGRGAPSELKRKWRRLSQMPPAQADAALARTLAMLEEKHPGKPRGWYLAKAVEELERSKH